MDYFDLLHQAQINNRSKAAQETRCYKTSFSAPKKMEKSRVSNDGIKKFLARKEEEEKQKSLEAQKKKEELLALRALDKKAQKRVQVMLKRTKSANKSVMDDAIDNYNTKDTLEGPQQCDEDDYGYVSQEASAFYEKMMAKYEKCPTENLKQLNREVKDLKAAKDRVKAALDREAEEQLHPTRKRKKKNKDDSLQDDDVGNQNLQGQIHEEEKQEEVVEEKPKKIPRKMPPPVDFFELMKIAAKKQHEPIVIEKKVEEPERPMTMKEKLERQREMERKNKKNNPKSQSNGKSSNKPSETARGEDPNKNSIKNIKTDSSKPGKSIIKSDLNSNNIKSQSNVKKEVKFGQNERSLPSIPKLSSSNSYKEKVSSSSDSKNVNSSMKNSQPSSKSGFKSKETEKPTAKIDVSDIDKEIELLMKKKQMMLEASKLSQGNNKSNTSPQRSKDHSQKLSDSQEQRVSKNSMNMPPKKADNKIIAAAKTSGIMRDKIPAKIGSDRDRLLKSVNDRDKLQSKPINDRDRPLPKAPRPSESKPSPSVPQRKMSPPRYGPPMRMPPPKMKKKLQKRVINSDSEYDSEMDDFIDDGPDESMDYSRHIKEIFGYDKSRYSHIDEDECEESSYKTQMIEERRSTRIGLLEDLEDIQREKEEKERAKMKKKVVRR